MSAKSNPTITKLPFVKDGTNGRSFWNVTPTGDYTVDCNTGERLAHEYLAAIEAGADAFLPTILRAMPREQSGIEVGFLTMIAEAARAGAENARRVSAYWDRCSKREPVIPIDEISAVNAWTAEQLRRGILPAQEIAAEAAQKLRGLAKRH